MNMGRQHSSRLKIIIALPILCCVLVVSLQSPLLLLFQKASHLQLPWFVERHDEEALCLLTETPHFVHFPHAAEQLYPCWSFFRAHPRLQCAFWLSTETRHPQGFKPGWIADIVKAMDCRVYRSQIRPVLRPSNTTVALDPVQRGDMFFRDPSDAQALTTRLLEHYHDQLLPLPYFTKMHSIAFVQRNGTRAITNLPEIQKAIEQRFPDSTFTVAYMEDMPHISHQVQFWNSYDVIITPHGAAVTNAAFMQRHAALVEVYPFNYTPPLFRVLCQRAGVRLYRYITTLNETTPVPPHRTCPCKRNVQMIPKVTALVNLVAQAVDYTKKANKSR